MKNSILGLLGGVVLSIATIFSTSPTPLVHSPSTFARIDLMVMSPDCLMFAPYWVTEVQRRYSDAVVVIVHGLGTPQGEWVMFPFGSTGVSVDLFVENLRNIHPTRRIVLVTCNPDGIECKLPGVTYATKNVLLVPRAAQSGIFTSVFTGDTVADEIAEFVENP